MLIQLSNNALIPTNYILSATLRTDLVPIPVSLELQVRHNDDLEKELVEEKILYVTGEAIPLQIIKSQVKKSGVIANRGTIEVTAIFAPCVAIGYRRQKAVILKNNSLGAIYKACGAKISIKNDFTVPLFVSFLGQLPSEMIARVLQEESAIVRVKSKQLDCVRLADLMTQPPRLTVPSDAAEQIASGFLERHLVPSFYSTDDSRTITKGNTSKVRTMQYSPRHSDRAINNMTSALITKNEMSLGYNDKLNAGDVVTVGDKPMAIITAAHVFETEADNEGGNQYTRLWLGELEK